MVFISYCCSWRVFLVCGNVYKANNHLLCLLYKASKPGNKWIQKICSVQRGPEHVIMQLCKYIGKKTDRSVYK